MKTNKYYLILSVVTGILCVSALGYDGLAADKSESLGRANPALTGIEELYVIIVPLYAGFNVEGLVWEELQAKIEQRIAEAGIRVVSGIYGAGVFRNYSIPELRANIDMLRLADWQQYVCRIQTSLATDVRLDIDPLSFLRSDVWTIGATVQPASVQAIPAVVTDMVMSQVEAFITAYLAANPQGIQPTEAGTRDTASPARRRERAEPATRPKPVVAEYEYVASKNSRVFHKPECSSAKRIKPENLIGYNSRDEAIKAGRRPCKRCNP